ncbi:hypothetical protein SERLA73DRAFT_179063 [Serpula lacrymans var. lacrymans S7.3]|uniref:Sugar phosphate transporter domain-containing protein n=2 Tax=Serpula lacrymans var. lacrymans TaxID=341189 RepID=F8PTN3_SERL3|nr:uncharacterized protein SERLADRAFT_464010 [Serpula lacrymans var. lacrymans S7.9]EGO01028.1 hypothetical protein SERLA73DRAFT_179063 [Serpula lacrymans var. lacrymans S7.3]EGO26694.1 hypothetical protein SERLADRAFT_464010 [Serpula lacrymans var. lacrymans S7.9]
MSPKASHRRTSSSLSHHDYLDKKPPEAHSPESHHRFASTNNINHSLANDTHSPNNYSRVDLTHHHSSSLSLSDLRIPVHNQDLDDLHHQKQPSIFYSSQAFWLVLYFCLNLGLTLYNKVVLIRFPFPYTLTAIHALCGSIGGYILLGHGVFTPAKLKDKDNRALIAFSVLYTVNIAVSNLSLQLVTIPLHQVVRAATPIFTIFLSSVLFGVRSSRQKVLSLVPVIAGVGLSTYGDYYCTLSGLLLTILGTVLAAFKTIFTSILQSPSSASNGYQPSRFLRPLLPPRLHLHPLDLLTRMAPLAFIQCMFLAQITGELDRVRQYSKEEMTSFKVGALVTNGIIAFALNIVSFTANKKVGPLSMTVAANVKQVLSIFFAVLMFNLAISPTNGMGILLTIAGGGWYAVIEYQEKRNRRRI